MSVFDDFLADDHAKSMALLKKAEAAAAESRELRDQVDHAIRTMGVTKTQVFLIEDRWSLGKMYRSFLFKVSPYSPGTIGFNLKMNKVVLIFGTDVS